MSATPAPNNSFLHGSLDSVALKRTRLPLQLLPIVDGTVGETIAKFERACEASAVKATATKRRSNLKVDADTSRSKHYASCAVVLPINPEILRTEDERKSEIEEGTPDEESTIPERIVFPPIVFDKTETCPREETSENVYEKVRIVGGTLDTEGASLERNVLPKSRSINDLATKSSPTEDDRVESFRKDKTEEFFSDDDEDHAFSDKRRRFSKNPARFAFDRTRRPNKSRIPRSLSASLSSLVTADIYRSRNLPRERLKCVTISSPSNFVHVASATNPRLVLNENTVTSNYERVVITHEQKCATLPLLVGEDKYCKLENENDPRSRVATRVPPFGASTLDGETTIRNVGTENRVNARGESHGSVQALPAKVLEQSQEMKTDEQNRVNANSSFLWGNPTRNLSDDRRRNDFPRSRDKYDEDEDSEAYDDVGPQILDEQESNYDDVGSPRMRDRRIQRGDSFSRDSEGIYDDVVALSYDKRDSSTFPPKEDDTAIDDSSPNDATKNRTNNNIAGDADSNPEEDIYLSINDEYSSVEEEDDESVYDDVGLPGEERVNSLYAGSTAGSISGLASTNGKESEWEDLEDPTVLDTHSSRKNNRWKNVEGQAVPGKKKSWQRKSRKRKSQRSGRSRSNGRPQQTSATRGSASSVAVSLGSGSVLLVGNAEKIEGEWSRSNDANATPDPRSQRTQGLVQMRVVDLDEDMDTQETSCYVHEGLVRNFESVSRPYAMSDDIYETLQSFQFDDFSTESETETGEIEAAKETFDKRKLRDVPQEAPARPTPPPPREASLSQTLGRRIKMLRRTWSITKGSLGRMRRRTSVEDDRCEDSNEQHHQQDPNSGKYFSFRRHFRKSVTGLSTFYFDEKITGNNDTSKKNANYTSKEPIYGNESYARRTSIAEGSDESSPGIRNNVDESRSRTVPDHYSILADQETLYQFYAAEAARVAFDSDSEGYEEVEDMLPLSTTTDLAKPGHRTLWCQTPEIRNSTLLETLTTEEKKIQEAKFEILTSEASYLNSLRVLEHEFINDPVLINEILTPNEKDKLFGTIPSVLQASIKLLAELETIWVQDPMLHALPDVLLKHADKFIDIYVPYCSNQVRIDSTLKEFRAEKGLKFLETVGKIEARSPCQSLTLHSFLMLPMQRITRLPLLADAVLSKLSMDHPDRSKWERVLSTLSYVVAECNEAARTAAQEAEMETLAGKLEYSPKITPIPLKGRHLIRSGSVVQILTKADADYKLTFGRKFNKTPLYLLLLTDYLLVTKFKTNAQNEMYTVIDTCKRNLIALESVPEDSPFAGRNGMFLTLLENYAGHQTEYILTCESNTERQRWLEAVSPSKQGLVGETLYESWDCPQVVALYPYNQSQPDELPLQPGDVVNVLKKMADGWYHGEKLLDGVQGWFPGNFAKEVASEHVRARNLKQRHRLLALSGSVLQRKMKQQSAIC